MYSACDPKGVSQASALFTEVAQTVRGTKVMLRDAKTVDPNVVSPAALCRDGESFHTLHVHFTKPLSMMSQIRASLWLWFQMRAAGLLVAVQL
eukprot:2875328-Amphidinium_carterae.1